MNAVKIEVNGHCAWKRDGKNGWSFLITNDEGLKRRLRLMEISSPESVSVLCDEGDNPLLALVDMKKYIFGADQATYGIMLLERVEE